MAERGTGTITVGGVTTRFRAPTRPEQAMLPTQVGPEEDRLKKFYTEQYNIEAQAFIKGPMSQEQFDRGISRLQAKYKMAFNQAKMKMETDQPDPAFKRWSELDVYRNRIEERLRDYNWTTDRGKTVLEVWNPNIGKKGGWTTKGITPERLHEAMTLTIERNRVRAEQTSVLQPGQTPLMRTAVTSPRIGGAIKDQARAYLEQRQGSEEDLSQLSDDELRQIMEGR
jgi:hypothetical protein